jgi:hypothetical protein
MKFKNIFRFRDQTLTRQRLRARKVISSNIFLPKIGQLGPNEQIAGSKGAFCFFSYRPVDSGMWRYDKNGKCNALK